MCSNKVGPEKSKKGKHFLYSEITAYLERILGFCKLILIGKQWLTFPIVFNFGWLIFEPKPKAVTFCSESY